MATIIGNWVAKGIPYVGNNWVPLPNMPAVRNSMAAFVSAGNVYLLGGSPSTSSGVGGTLNPQPFWRYNTVSPGSYTIFATPTTPSSRYYAWAVGGSDPLVGGGLSVLTGFTNMFQYNTATNTWSALASMPNTANASAAHQVGTNVHLLGSWEPSVSNPLQGRNTRYDRLSNTWTNLSPPLVGNRGGQGTVYNGKIILQGLEYDPATNTTTVLTSKPGTTQNFFAGGGDGAGNYFVVGGGTGNARTPGIGSGGPGTVTTDVYRYSRLTNTWSGPLNPLPTARVWMATVVIGTRLYCFGGHNTVTGTTQLADAYDM